MAAAGGDQLKKAVGYRAVDDYVKSGMTVGLGTGSTAYFAVERVGEKLKNGELKGITCIPTSIATKEQAIKLGIPLRLPEESDELSVDVTIDGADEATRDASGSIQLVKGRGGALLREKLIERRSKRFVVIVDHTKIVKIGLGCSGPLPVEVVPCAWRLVRTALLGLPQLAGPGLSAELRRGETGDPYVTDNQNYIINLTRKEPLREAEEAGRAILGVTGVVDHGLFINIATDCLIATSNGTVELF